MPRLPQMNRIWGIAQSQYGVEEIPGDEHHPQIIEYFTHTELAAMTDETAWCSAFANWVIDKAGLHGTNSARARSWEAWGDQITDQPQSGDVVVFSRGNNPALGHVAPPPLTPNSGV